MKIKGIHGVYRAFSNREAIKRTICKKNEDSPYAIKSHNLLQLAENVIWN